MNKSLNSSFDLPSLPGQGIFSNDWNPPSHMRCLLNKVERKEEGEKARAEMRRAEGRRREETGGYVRRGEVGVRGR